MKSFGSFCRDCLKLVFRGGRSYWIWNGGLLFMAIAGLGGYTHQLIEGLAVTHMSDQVNWGLYISNFIFMGGVSAASLVLVVAAFLYRQPEAAQSVTLGLGIAIAAAVMCGLFITVDLGRPDRLWHIVPFLGELSFPYSMLAWDAVVLNTYIPFTLGLAIYILFLKYNNREPATRGALFVLGNAAILFAISMLTVEAFLLSGHVARPLWNTAVLVPRFVVAAFAASSAIIILVLRLLDRFTERKEKSAEIGILVGVLKVAVLINLFLIAVEFFTHFYHPTDHSASAIYLYFGLDGRTMLVPWTWTSLAFGVIAVIILFNPRLRGRRAWLNLACVLTVMEIWIEKSMGLLIPGFIPTPLGEIFEYLPSPIEILVSLGVLAIGMLIFTLIAKIAIHIELGHTRYSAPDSN
ncbi:MAG: polysulfide reductase NrfD [SAR324 cluster bacterium]|nr:polysulfide reductase NrfD [SAR324 cluster bacterium]